MYALSSVAEDHFYSQISTWTCERSMYSNKTWHSYGRFRVCLGAEVPPPKFYYEQTGKFLYRSCSTGAIAFYAYVHIYGQ